MHGRCIAAVMILIPALLVTDTRPGLCADAPFEVIDDGSLWAATPPQQFFELDSADTGSEIQQTLFQERNVFQAPSTPQVQSNRANAGTRSLADLSRTPGQSAFAPRYAGLQVRQPPAASSFTARSVSGSAATTRVATDAGSLPARSSSARVSAQQRNPIITNTKVDGSRSQQLTASGSYWVPARMDLDTALSKIDANILDQMTVIKGPFSVRHGPGFSFLDVDLLASPRFADGDETHGLTALDYKANGEQWNGRQSIWGGSDDWGIRIDYGHRTGVDYTDGAGRQVPSSYKSRQLHTAIGIDPTENSSVEFHYLRLDQTDIELPGQAFDIDYLVTDGFDLTYEVEDQQYFDRLVVDTWYNHTRFEGSAQRPAKRQLMPFYDTIRFVGNTDVGSTSTGYSTAVTWGDPQDAELAVGTDLRVIRQELNEITSGRFGLAAWSDANSPIPESYTATPGLFADATIPAGSDLTLKAGSRVDWFNADVTDDVNKLQSLGTGVPQSSLADILGTSDFDQQATLWAAYLSAELDLGHGWKFNSGAAHAQRPPTLTELYAAETFMFLLQNGQNTVTGDPLLKPEQLWELDLGFRYEGDRTRAEIRGFHKWVSDYITFENMGVVRTPPNNQVEQVQLKFVNTDLATLAGGEALWEFDKEPWMTFFSTLQFVEGRDRTRNGSFATQQATSIAGSSRVPGLARGELSGVQASGTEPLPGILPFETTIGVRLHEPGLKPRWNVEVSNRIVDGQDNVARSLLETPTSGFNTWDLRAYCQLTDQILVYGGVENFTNQLYREHLDFRSQNGIAVFRPGSNFYIGSEMVY